MARAVCTSGDRQQGEGCSEPLCTAPGLGAGDEDFDDAEVAPADLGHEVGAGEGGVEVDEVDGVAGVGDDGDGWAADAGAGGEEAVLSTDCEARAQ